MGDSWHHMLFQVYHDTVPCFSLFWCVFRKAWWQVSRLHLWTHLPLLHTFVVFCDPVHHLVRVLAKPSHIVRFRHCQTAILVSELNSIEAKDRLLGEISLPKQSCTNNAGTQDHVDTCQWLRQEDAKKGHATARKEEVCKRRIRRRKHVFRVGEVAKATRRWMRIKLLLVNQLGPRTREVRCFFDMMGTYVRDNQLLLSSHVPTYAIDLYAT